MKKGMYYQFSSFGLLFLILVHNTVHSSPITITTTTTTTTTLSLTDRFQSMYFLDIIQAKNSALVQAKISGDISKIFVSSN